jgi:UDP-N-acetyl-D-galactosamine dehydrogenase
MNERIGIVGLGYVGLPLAVAFAQHFDVMGFDLSSERVDALNRGEDETGESEDGELENPRLTFTSNSDDLRDCTFIVVAVPTPITTAKEPDLTALRSASETVGNVLAKGAMVVYESTVYPGVTEEVCLPILEEKSGLKLGEFDLG